jgi:hypothetical protein
VNKGTCLAWRWLGDELESGVMESRDMKEMKGKWSGGIGESNQIVERACKVVRMQTGGHGHEVS